MLALSSSTQPVSMDKPLELRAERWCLCWAQVLGMAESSQRLHSVPGQ
jgi:hypothetical protein